MCVGGGGGGGRVKVKFKKSNINTLIGIKPEA